ncbi:hypothetical protein [Curvibacter gracilis]|uniref:hypothetical protein n=1 Tax=Curvibacter gracilis TaxID=230310 RepID=UPI0012F85DBE|nr:hypothetical protein [Curvibacter gracilis]
MVFDHPCIQLLLTQILLHHLLVATPRHPDNGHQQQQCKQHTREQRQLARQPLS